MCLTMYHVLNSSFNLMSDKLTEDKNITTATSIMVLILQENYSFNLLSRLFYILYLRFLAMFIVKLNQTDKFFPKVKKRNLATSL